MLEAGTSASTTFYAVSRWCWNLVGSFWPLAETRYFCGPQKEEVDSEWKYVLLFEEQISRIVPWWKSFWFIASLYMEDQVRRMAEWDHAVILRRKMDFVFGRLEISLADASKVGWVLWTYFYRRGILPLTTANRIDCCQMCPLLSHLQYLEFTKLFQEFIETINSFFTAI